MQAVRVLGYLGLGLVLLEVVVPRLERVRVVAADVFDGVDLGNKRTIQIEAILDSREREGYSEDACRLIYRNTTTKKSPEEEYRREDQYHSIEIQP